jgi:1-acyl-sn-glycerol-3-phosphate acyltransferase
VAIFNSRDVFRLGIAPEGTRKKVTELRTGFYYIALKANVPIVPVAFDYSKKEVRIGAPIYVTGDIESDMKLFLSHFKGVVGKMPERSFLVN